MKETIKRVSRIAGLALALNGCSTLQKGLPEKTGPIVYSDECHSYAAMEEIDKMRRLQNLKYTPTLKFTYEGRKAFEIQPDSLNPLNVSSATFDLAVEQYNGFATIKKHLKDYPKFRDDLIKELLIPQIKVINPEYKNPEHKKQ